jgi:hypothetical protein
MLSGLPTIRQEKILSGLRTIRSARPPKVSQWSSNVGAEKSSMSNEAEYG